MVTRKTSWVFGFMAVVTLAVPVTALGDITYEPFDYGAGANLDGLTATGANLTGAYTTTSILDLSIGSPGLDYGNLQGPLPSVAGNMLMAESVSTAGIVLVDVGADIMTGPGTTTYFAALFRLDDTNNRVKRASVHLIDADNGDTITFGEDIAGVRAIRVSASTVATGGNSVAAAEDTAFENGQTFWMIGRYFNSDVVDGDILQLLAYDIEDSESIASEFDLTDPAADVVLSLSGVTIDLAKISMLRFEVRGASDNFIDELRIGQSFDEVTRGLFAAVPEPASGIHVLCGIVTAGFLSAYHGLRRRESVSLQRQHER